MLWVSCNSHINNVRLLVKKEFGFLRWLKPYEYDVISLTSIELIIVHKLCHIAWGHCQFLHFLARRNQVLVKIEESSERIPQTISSTLFAFYLIFSFLFYSCLFLFETKQKCAYNSIIHVTWDHLESWRQVYQSSIAKRISHCRTI